MEAEKNVMKKRLKLAAPQRQVNKLNVLNSQTSYAQIDDPWLINGGLENPFLLLSFCAALTLCMPIDFMVFLQLKSKEN